MVMPRCRIPILIVAGFLPRLPRYSQGSVARQQVADLGFLFEDIDASEQRY